MSKIELNEKFFMLYPSDDPFVYGGGSEMYSDINLPFWMQTRVETLTEDHVQQLENVGCNRISIGLEHGNEEFRKKRLL